MKESTELVFGPLMNVLIAMLLLVVYVLMGHKVTTGRGWGKKSGEGSSRGGSIGKRKGGKAMGEDSQSKSDSESLEEFPPSPSNAQRRKEKAKK